jgi:hypothetical protein
VPLHGKLATPFVLLPVINTVVEVNRSNHLSHTTELTTAINLWKMWSKTKFKTP